VSRSERFAKLAGEFAARDRELPAALAQARSAGLRLREVAAASVTGFCEAARSRGAEHLAGFEVSALGPDEKHVDCLQFSVARGSWQQICVIRAGGSVTLVGPFRRGKPEKPCADFPQRGEAVERGLEDAIESLIRSALEL
jgi:hypothetical protein